MSRSSESVASRWVQVLESRRLLSGAASDDTFAPVLGSDFAGDLPATVVAGSTGKLPLTITNYDYAPATGSFDVRVYASTDAVLDASDALVGSLTARLGGLRPDATRAIPLAVNYPTAAGTYNLIINVVDATTGEDVDLAIGISPVRVTEPAAKPAAAPKATQDGPTPTFNGQAVVTWDATRQTADDDKKTVADEVLV